MSPPPDGAPGWTALFSRRYARTTIGLVALETLAAVVSLVTVAVLPAVTHDLGDLRLYGAALAAPTLAMVVVLPLTPALVGRLGLRAVFLASSALYVAGTAVVVLAPTMAVFVAGRLAQGAAGGAQAVLVLAIFARRYPTGLRASMLAVWSTAWALPGLVGPAYGGLVASALGWRWAFALLLPLLVPPVFLLLPDLAPRAATAPPDVPAPAVATPRWLATLGGVSLVLVGLLLGGRGGGALAAAGGLATLLALRAILPPGTFHARRGLPAVMVAAFAVSAAFFAVDGFLPAMLTGLRGLHLAAASLVLSLGVLGWVVGTWWQSRAVTVRRAPLLVAAGAAVIAVGVVGAVLGTLGAPLWVPYLGWAVAGLGMGVAYPTITLLATDHGPTTDQVVTLSRYQLAETLGAAVGPGLGGVALSVSLASGAGLRTGLLAGFTMALALSLGTVAVAGRLPGLAEAPGAG